MYKVFSWLSILISLLFSLESVFALEVPFTDIKPSDPYYESIGELYEGRIITDNGDHLFRPKDLMNRDFFVSLAVGIGCHQCETPSTEDIVKYQISPFIDLPKINRYYYCTAYAKDINVIQGYVADTTGQSTCEDGKKYMSSPFCSENTISRIEATAILLRQAKIWDDTRNSGNFEKNLSIPDTTAYWYGYAKKGIETKIITQKSNGEIGQNDKITRGEFAMMAARILRYTQCDTKGKEYTIPSAINILDGSGTIIEKSHFSSGEIFSIVPNTQSGTWDYRWSATNITTGQTISGSGKVISNTTLSNSGSWLIVMNTIDPNSKKVVSQATTTLNISGGQDTGTGSCLLLRSNPLIGITGSSFRFTANVCGNNALQNYSWDYGDGNTSTITGSTTHNYTASGIYTITLTVTDTISNRVGQSSVTIQVTGGKDTDNDGILDIKDECPLVYAKTPTGCPQIETYKLIVRIGNTNTIGNGDYNNNICLIRHNKEQGLLIGKPNCIQCPCSNTISIDSPLRSCDIVFPTILSPTLDTVYSRGGFYLIP